MKRLTACLLLGFAVTSCDEVLVESEKVLYARAESFQSNPTEDRLRKLLNSRADGAASYLKMALVGEAFAEHPDQFKRIAGDLKTREERESFQLLREYGSGVFEYYPERKPETFGRVYGEATWLTKAKAEQGAANQPATALESRPESGQKSNPESEGPSQ